MKKEFRHCNLKCKARMTNVGGHVLACVDPYLLQVNAIILQHVSILEELCIFCTSPNVLFPNVDNLQNKSVTTCSRDVFA